MRTRFTGVGTALITPFTATGAVDDAAVRRLARRQIDLGTHFLVPCGTTGEVPTLTAAERRRIVEIVVDEAGGTTPVLAGAGGYDTHEVAHAAKEMQAAGADGLLSVTPYYNRPTQEGQYLHFKAIAEAVELPMVLYNVPGRTVADMSVDTALRLAQLPGIVGIKEASGNIDKAQQLIKDAPKGFAIYSGDDPTAVALMLCGGHGNISVTANIAPKLMHELCVAAIAGDVKAAMAIQFKLLHLHKQMGIEANPIPVKWALLEMGLIVARQAGELRRQGLFIIAFGLLMPVASSAAGVACGVLLGLSTGGVALLATLAASASYIAVPATMRLALPEANPALSLAAVLSVTFPFNILVGIPLYYELAAQVSGVVR